MQTNPYEILGVKETDSPAEIERVFNNYVKLLHPDRAHTVEARHLGMSNEEKLQYMQILRDAYNRLMNVKRETKYPDYVKQYTIDKSLGINMAPDLKGIKYEFDNELFNKVFAEGLDRDKKAGIVDAYSRGYEDFDKGRNFNSTEKVAPPSYTDTIDVSKSKVFTNTDNRIIEFAPNIFDNGTEYQELGLTSVSNFSITTTGKTALGGSDLMAVYGQNYEPWEKVAMRDAKLQEKFSDLENVQKKMARLEGERGGIYDIPLDYNMLESERARNFALAQQEKIRMANKTYRDEYYNELNKGRLDDIRQI
jgi:curved DNA-binding protein CbpA